MLDEICVGVEHLCSLLTGVPLSAQAMHAFCSTLGHRLEARYATNWFPLDGERGSAQRALICHVHGGGEGLDADVQAACRHLFSNNGHGKPSAQDAAALFKSAFTLWIDPGCVAVRHGYGPGTYIEGAAPQPQSFTLLYGSVPRLLPPPVHAVAAMAAGMPPPPTVTLLPSTPALDVETSNEQHHYRVPSWSSTSTSSHYRTTTNRSSSLGTSSMSGDSEACPSLVAPSSTRSDSESEPEDDDDAASSSSEMSIHDMIDRAGFKNFDIIDDEEDDGDDEALEQALERRLQLVDDMTIGNDGETTVGLFGATALDGDETVLAGVHQQEPQQNVSGAPITSYDGGNVGVLGGGVRLGASKAPKPMAAKPDSSALRGSAQSWLPCHAWDSDSGKARVTTTFSPESKPTALPVPRPAAYARAWAASPALLGLSLPGSTTAIAADLPSPTSAASPYSVSLGTPQMQYVIVDGYAVPVAKRGRARGRRSRGRGAGRAARRQAAAAASATSTNDEGVADDCSFGNEACPSALGITLGPQRIKVDESDADARLMALVRQRADLVAKDLVRRHLQQEQQQQRSMSLESHPMPPRPVNTAVPRHFTPRLPFASPALHGGQSPAFVQLPAMPAAAVAHQQQHQQPYMARSPYLPAHMSAHMMHHPPAFSPRMAHGIASPQQWHC